MDEKNFRCKITAELKEPARSGNSRAQILLDTHCSPLDITVLLADVVESVLDKMNPENKAKAKAHIITYLMFPESFNDSKKETIIDMSKLRRD